MSLRQFFSALVLLSLGVPSAYAARIGTWNMEWFSGTHGEGMSPRQEDDYKAIAEVIRETGAAILGVEEVEGARALQERLINPYLGSGRYRTLVARDNGSQNPGVIWDSEQASVTELPTPQALAFFIRPPLVARFQIGSFDGTLVVVHLKAGQDERSVNRRNKEARALHLWASDYLADANNDRDLIILGDFNCAPEDTLRAADNKTELDIHQPRESTFRHSFSMRIDYFLMSPGTRQVVLSQTIEVLKNNSKIRELYSQHHVSDHWPVVIDLEGGTVAPKPEEPPTPPKKPRRRWRWRWPFPWWKYIQAGGEVVIGSSAVVAGGGPSDGRAF